MTPEENDTDKTETEIRPDFYLYLVDESKDWRIEEEEQAKVDRIVTIYLFDRNRVTHCCELTPSYELAHLETRAELKQSVYDAPDYEHWQDRLSDTVQKNQDDSIKYIHCHGMDGTLTPENKDKLFFHIGDTKVDFGDVNYEDQVEALLEHYRCNQAL